jgi:hypothetical protein
MSKLKISNINLVPSGNNALVQFNVQWNNAWKNNINCDGIWIFAKYKNKNGLWEHINLGNASNHVFDYSDQTPDSFSKGISKDQSVTGIWVPETKKGAFIYRTNDRGNVDLQNVQLLWKYQEDGVNTIKNIEVKVFGVEMVYIPEDKHYVGEPIGGHLNEKGERMAPLNCLYVYPKNGAYLVDSEKEIIIDAKEGHLYCNQDNERSRDEVPFTIPATFPKGYKAFWYMKYGLNSRQYVDFLNCLTRKQQQTHVRSDISQDIVPNYHVMTNSEEEKYRQSIVCALRNHGTTEPIEFYTYAPARACNAIAWADTAAYAAWSGLRPVTDFEFEKACRGPKEAVSWECAWGSNEIGRADTFDGADGSGDEIKIPKKGLVNACYGQGIAPFEAAAGKTEADNPGFEGPVSCGLYEKTRHEGIPERLNDGASYYGNLELSGNCWEPVVTFGSPEGRNFKPVHGNGSLDSDGHANVETWPNKTGKGTGVRGGVYRSPNATFLAVALRFAGCHAKADPRYNGGIRVGF